MPEQTREQVFAPGAGGVTAPRRNGIKLGRLGCFAAVFLSAASPSFANELSGIWLRDTGEARLKFDSCGGAMCGTIIWLKPGIASKAKIGQRVFYEMKPSGANSWTGKAIGPDSGSVYSGKLSVQGSNLSTSGCLAGGMICRSMNWTRVP